MSFVLIVFLVAALNFAVGYGAAIYLRRLEEWPIEEDLASEVSVPQPVQTEAIETEPEVVEEADEEPAPEPAPVVEEIPEEWLELLEDAENSTGFVDASIQVFKLEIGRYREELIGVDTKVRGCLADPEAQSIGECLDELKKANEDYLQRQGDATSHLSDRRESLGDLSDVGGQLEDVLMEQAAQIETTVSNIEVLDFETDIRAGCRRLVSEICKLLDSCHRLRDSMHESLVAVAVAEDRLDRFDKDKRKDGLTGLWNRCGVEKTVLDWWMDDPSRNRTCSVGLIDLDRFGAFNEEFGAPMADQLLYCAGQLLEDSLRKDRGHDVIGRFDGQRFLMFFGDTGPRNATSAVERTRLTAERSTFEFEGRELELTFSAGVTDIRSDDTTQSLFQRAAGALRKAKQQGRNCTCLDAGEKTEIVTPPELKVKGRVYRLTA